MSTETMMAKGLVERSPAERQPRYQRDGEAKVNLPISADNHGQRSSARAGFWPTRPAA